MTQRHYANLPAAELDVQSRPQTAHHLHHPVSDGERNGENDGGDGDDHEQFDQRKSASLHWLTVDDLQDRHPAPAAASPNGLTARAVSIASKEKWFSRLPIRDFYAMRHKGESDLAYARHDKITHGDVDGAAAFAVEDDLLLV